MVSAIGLASEDPEGHRLRVRDSAEIVVLENDIVDEEEDNKPEEPSVEVKPEGGNGSNTGSNDNSNAGSNNNSNNGSNSNNGTVNGGNSALPNTGGVNSTIYVIIAIIIVAAGAIVLFKKKSKK